MEQNSHNKSTRRGDFMTNIWGFLTQTLSVSVIAALILLIKTLLNDKLSPRWQYGIWSILAFRILFPVPVKAKIILPIPVWVETLKSIVEKGLNSNYSDVYIPAKLTHIFPNAVGVPKSITDWIFVIYAVGIIVSLMWYMVSYLKLRQMLKRGAMPSENAMQTIETVCKKYHLKRCNVVAIKGLPSAFVCGGWNTILALPAEKEVDEKVILHELLHLKYHDEMQSFLWCILRSFHWCNPFLQYVFCRIENDMESLCDQRVLERLEGEERREYGMILLDMANEKYARMPGTSSISNGGRNIGCRIAAIVRFKKYPKGMSLVSICIGILLFFEAFVGQAQAGSEKEYQPVEANELHYALANARVNRCTTVAGALDTYAKGLLLENGIYVATASPLEKQVEIETKLMGNEPTSNPFYHYDAGEEFDQLYSWDGYRIYNLIEVEENQYEAILTFSVTDEVDSRKNSLLVPVEVRYEDAWVVEEMGERRVTPFEVNSVSHPSLGIPAGKTYHAEGEHGTAEISLISEHHIKNEVQQTSFLGMAAFDESVKVNAEFEYVYLHDVVEYTCKADRDGDLPQKTYGFQYNLVDKEGNAAFEDITTNHTNRGSGMYGNVYAIDDIQENYRGLESQHNSSCGYSPDEVKDHIPNAYRMKVYWDGEEVEELTLTETEPDNQKLYAVTEKTESDYSIYISSKSMRDLKSRMDFDYQEAKKNGKIVEEVSYITKRDALEAAMFSYGIEEKETLETYGIYECDLYGSYSPSLFINDTKILEPKLYYNAENGEWIITCGGYYTGDDYKKQLLPGDVGGREHFGFKITEKIGEYTSYVTDSYANIQDSTGNKREETTNRSSGVGSEGVDYELQDYTYLDSSLQLQYVGARWYCANSYAPGFENISGELSVFYNHKN